MENLIKELQERFGDGYTINFVKVPKNNMILEGFQVSQKGNIFEPIFYPNLANEAENKADFWEPIIKEYLGMEFPVDIAEIEKTKFLSTHLQMRLVSISGNEKLLEQYRNVPVPELDLAVLFNIRVNNWIDILIPRNEEILTDISDEELYRIAYENDARVGYRTLTLDEAAHTDGELGCEDADDPNCMRVIQNAKGWDYGASVLMHKDVLKKCADELGTSLVLIPISIHEIIYFKDIEANKDELDGLKTSLALGNRCMPLKDVLAFHLYKFNRDTQEVTIAK